MVVRLGMWKNVLSGSKIQGDLTINLPDAGAFTVKDDDGTDILTATDGGAGADTVKSGVGLQLFAATDTVAGGPYVLLSSGTENDTIFDLDVNEHLEIQSPGGTTLFKDGLRAAGSFSLYNNISTAGLGVPAIYAAVFLPPQTSAVTLSYTPPARAGSYKIELTVYVTVAGTSTIPQLSYHDMAGGVHTSEAMAMKQTTTANAAVVSIVATGTWVYVGGHIGIDNSGTAISVVTTPTASTFSIDGEILEYQ